MGKLGEMGLTVHSLANILDYIPIFFIVSKDSEELSKCYKSLRSKEGISLVM